jgi:hypothetical protein
LGSNGLVVNVDTNLLHINPDTAPGYGNEREITRVRHAKKERVAAWALDKGFAKPVVGEPDLIWAYIQITAEHAPQGRTCHDIALAVVQHSKAARTLLFIIGQKGERTLDPRLRPRQCSTPDVNFIDRQDWRHWRRLPLDA